MAGAVETPIGLMPEVKDLSLEGLDIDAAVMQELLKVDTDAYKATVENARTYLAQFGDRLPAKMTEQLDKLAARLG
jgi:phosphoenolpyruvate carboxykinase (GTP)